MLLLKFSDSHVTSVLSSLFKTSNIKVTGRERSSIANSVRTILLQDTRIEQP